MPLDIFASLGLMIGNGIKGFPTFVFLEALNPIVVLHNTGRTKNHQG